MVLICLQGDTGRFKAFWSVARTFIKASAFLSAVITAFSFSRAQMELPLRIEIGIAKKVVCCIALAGDKGDCNNQKKKSQKVVVVECHGIEFQ